MPRHKDEVGDGHLVADEVPPALEGRVQHAEDAPYLVAVAAYGGGNSLEVEVSEPRGWREEVGQPG